MNEEAEILMLVAERLEGAGIHYMLSGSMALNFYGQPRMTRDLDIVVDLGRSDAERILELFRDEFECDLEDIRDSIRRERMFNLIHVAKVVKVDFVVRKSSPYRLEEFARRRKVDYLGTGIWIVAPEDLVLSKLAWAKDSSSELQLRDVRNLVTSVTDLDWPYLARWAADLGVTKLLSEVKP